MRTGCSARPWRRPGASLHAGAIDAHCEGCSLVELLFVIGCVATMTAVAVPGLTTAIARYRTLGAARYVAATLQRARVLAVSNGANVGVRFLRIGDGFRFGLYVDGNRNGLSSRDIVDGSDPPLGTSGALESFGGVQFGLWPGVTLPDGTLARDDDPIRVGASSLVSFTPSGTSSSGSLYIRGTSGQQYALRIYGDTGKTQILRYVASQRLWVPL